MLNFMIFSSSMCKSHEENPSILDFKVEFNTIYLELQINLNVLLQQKLSHEESSALELVDPDREASEKSSIDDIAELIFKNWGFIRTKIFVAVDDQQMALKLSEVSVKSEDSDPKEKVLNLQIEAKLPDNPKYLILGWEDTLGDLVVREQGNAQNLYSDYLSKGMKTSQIFLKDAKATSRSDQFLSYVVSGIYHIVPIGYDHILFIIGLYLFANRLSVLALQVTLFTLAHSISLILSALNFISVPSSIVEPIIAISIIYVGLENYFGSRKNRNRVIIVFGFGLLHGLGFASVLKSLELSKDSLVMPLLGFNLGVEIGQILVLAACYSSFGYWFQEKIWYRQRIVKPLSGILVLAGGFWLISRLI